MVTIKKADVSFSTSDELLQKLMDSASEKCKRNIRTFGGKPVLVEGGGYEKIWLETQPMGGAMYAKRNMEVAFNNQKMFMDNQRDDGRIPGSITVLNGNIVPQFDKFQGFCFPEPALDMYYLIGKDSDYLDELYSALGKFDDYLWRVRDSDNDGCLETWCKYDTGEDNAERYGDAPNAWTAEIPPEGHSTVPMESVDVMSFSYASRHAMAEIAHIRNDNSDYDYQNIRAEKARRVISDYLWNDQIGALFDRDSNNEMMKVLTHSTLRAMYWNSISADKAQRFVNEHLLNEKEFWTEMPLPSVSISDPMFRNIKTNNWSGQPEALTYQRAIRALENYGYYALIPHLGRKLFNAIGANCCFVQQYDPFTMQPSEIALDGKQDAYGPAMLSVMEYCSRMYGIHICRERIIWGTVDGTESDYTQCFGDNSYRLVNSKNKAYGYIDGNLIFTAGRNLRITTEMNGKLLNVDKYSDAADIHGVISLV